MTEYKSQSGMVCRFYPLREGKAVDLRLDYKAKAEAGEGQSHGVETSLGQMSNLTNEGTPEDRWVGHRVSQLLMLGCDLFTVEVSLL